MKADIYATFNDEDKAYYEIDLRVYSRVHEISIGQAKALLISLTVAIKEAEARLEADNGTHS